MFHMKYNRYNSSSKLKITLDILLIIYSHTNIYRHPQTDLFRSIRTHQCGLTVASR